MGGKEEETNKIYITLPQRYIDVLEILAGDPKAKSTTFEKILDDYIDLRKERLVARGIWDRVMAALQGKPLVDNIAEMITFIDNYLIRSKDDKFKAHWNAIKNLKDEEKIKNIYNLILTKIKQDQLEYEKIGLPSS
jgi:hypothetical protein